MASNRQYEYFGNQNPTLNGKYNRGKVDAQRLANDKAVLGNINTPFGLGYQIGSTIGNAWADAYNDGGISKGRAEMNDALNGYLGQFGEQQAQPQEPQGPLANMMSKNNGDMTYSANAPKGEDAGMGSQFITTVPVDPSQPQNYAEYRKAYKDEEWLSKYRNPNTPNPTGDAIASQKDAQEMNKLGNNIDFDKVDKEQAREYVRQQLEAKGRTPYQIEQVLGQFDSIYDNKFNKWNKAKGTDYLQKGINAMSGDKPDYNTAFMNLAAANARGDKQAGVMLQRLQYMQARQDRLEAEARNRQWQKDLINYKLSLGIGGRGSRSGGSSSGGGSASSGTLGSVADGGLWIGRKDAVSDKDLTGYLKVIKDLEGRENLSPQQQRALDFSKNEVLRYGSPEHGAVRGFNLNSEADVQNYIRGVAKTIDENENISGTDILRRIKTSGITKSPYWKDEYLDLLGLTSDAINEY